MQKKFLEREKKILEEKSEEIKNLKIEIDSLNVKSKKYVADNEKEFLKRENKNLKDEIGHLKSDLNLYSGMKEKCFNLEKSLITMQNVFANKNVEFTQIESECEKLKLEKSKTENILNEKIVTIEILQKELIDTKQRMGDVLNELSEMEKKKNMSAREVDTKKKKK
jgi:hypothetical protein